MLKWLTKLLDRSNDPVYSCRVHKEIGCAHIDGMLCDMKTCGILEQYLKEQPTGEEG